MFSKKTGSISGFLTRKTMHFVWLLVSLDIQGYFLHYFIVYDNTVLFENQPLFQMKKQPSPFPSVSASALDNFFRIRYHTFDFYSYC